MTVRTSTHTHTHTCIHTQLQNCRTCRAVSAVKGAGRGGEGSKGVEGGGGCLLSGEGEVKRSALLHVLHPLWSSARRSRSCVSVCTRGTGRVGCRRACVTPVCACPPVCAEYARCHSRSGPTGSRGCLGETVSLLSL